MKGDESLGKEYKLCRRKTIDILFKEGKKVKEYPFQVYYVLEDEHRAKSFEVVFSAPKRRHRNAVDRNRVKRLMREAFRKNKCELESFLMEQHKQLAIFVVYNSSKILDYHIQEEKMKTLLKRLTKKIIE